MAYFDKYGVEFSDDRKTLVKCPENFQGEYVIPDGVTVIKNFAFRWSSIKSVIFPDSVWIIGDWAFDDCSQLTSVKLPNSITSTGNGTFFGCKGLTFIDIPKSVTSIGEKAFCCCTGLTSVSIPNRIRGIGNNAFSNCSNLTSVTIPKDVIFIGTSAFSGCDSMSSINVETDNSRYSSVDGVLFNKDRTKLIQYPCGKILSSYVVPNGIEGITKDAFWKCSHLTSISIPNSIIEIEEDALKKCNNLAFVTIPDRDEIEKIVKQAIGDKIKIIRCKSQDFHNGANIENPPMIECTKCIKKCIIPVDARFCPEYGTKL